MWKSIKPTQTHFKQLSIYLSIYIFCMSVYIYGLLVDLALCHFLSDQWTFKVEFSDFNFSMCPAWTCLRGRKPTTQWWRVTFVLREKETTEFNFEFRQSWDSNLKKFNASRWRTVHLKVYNIKSKRRYSCNIKRFVVDSKPACWTFFI